MAVPERDRIPPHNDDAEKAIIGAMLIDEGAIIVAQQFLKADDFYSPRHRKIFDAVLSLYNKGVRPDLLTINGELEKTGKLDESGGIDYIASLTHAVPSSANADYYAQIVQNTSLRRNLIHVSGDSASRAYDETVDPKFLIEDTQRKLFLINDPTRIFQYKKTENVINNVFNYLSDLYKNKKEYTGIPSGFSALDRLTLGFQPAELIIIGARPGVGKTAIALSMAANITIRQNIPAAFFSLEMSDRSLMIRLISAESGLDSQKLRTGLFTKLEHSKFFAAAELIHDAPLFIVDIPLMNISGIQSMSRMLRIQEKVEIIFIDYIGLIASDNPRLARYELISEVSRSLKGLSRELNIPIIVCSQLRRDAETQKPSLADIRESGSIEQDADMVMLLSRDRELEKSDDDLRNAPEQKVLLQLAKNRNGPTGPIDLTFIRNLTKFVPATEPKDRQ